MHMHGIKVQMHPGGEIRLDGGDWNSIVLGAACASPEDSHLREGNDSACVDA